MLFESLGTKESLANMTNLLKSGIVSSSMVHRVITQLMIGCLSGKISNKTAKYKIRLINLSIDQIDFNSELKKLLNKWLINVNYEEIVAGYYYTLADVLSW